MASSHWRVNDLTQWSLHDVPRLREKHKRANNAANTTTHGAEDDKENDKNQENRDIERSGESQLHHTPHAINHKDVSSSCQSTREEEEDDNNTSAPTAPIFRVNRDFNSRIRLFQGHQLCLHVDVCATSAVSVSDADIQEGKLHVRPSLSRLLDVIRHRRMASETEDDDSNAHSSNSSNNTHGLCSGVIHINTTASSSPHPVGAPAATTMQPVIPARFMMHAAAPRYSSRYHTAAENALSQCVRTFLEEAAERKYCTIALGNHSRHGQSSDRERRGRGMSTAVKQRRYGDYPVSLAAHVTARTIRRFLDLVQNKSPVFDSIIICAASHEEYCALADVLRYYFPRDSEEERIAAQRLSQRDIGNHLGEAWLPERNIQIAECIPRAGAFVSGQTTTTNSGKKSIQSDAPSDSPSVQSSSLSPDTPDFTEGDRSGRRFSSPITPPLSSSTLDDDGSIHYRGFSDVDGSSESASSFREFLSPSPSPDTKRGRHSQLQNSHCYFSPSTLLYQQTRGMLNATVRAQWRKESLVADLSMVSAMKVFYYGGTDLGGRPVMVCIGAHAKPNVVSIKDIYYQCIREIEGIGDQKYIIMYAHTDVQSTYNPSHSSPLWRNKRGQRIDTSKTHASLLSLEFFHSLYCLLTDKQRQNLDAFLILQPSLTMRTSVSIRGISSLSSMAMASISLLPRKITSANKDDKSCSHRSIYRKIILCAQLRDVWQYVDRKSIQLPEFILDYNKA